MHSISGEPPMGIGRNEVRYLCSRLPPCKQHPWEPIPITEALFSIGASLLTEPPSPPFVFALSIAL